VFADEPGFVPAIGAKFLFRYTKAFDSIVVGHQMDPEILLAHRKVVLRWLRLMFEILSAFFRSRATLRDRIPISKISSLQSHRQMGVPMQGRVDCAIARSRLNFPQAVEDFMAQAFVAQLAAGLLGSM
jgi:hypothetical protein